MAQHILVSEARNLVSPFKGDKREVLAFISNVDTAFVVITRKIQCIVQICAQKNQW
jgi:hypothetical protein